MTAYEQLRMATARQIAENPTVITPMRRALVSDGYGGWVRSGSASAQPRARGRLVLEGSSVPRTAEVPTGLDTALSAYFLTDYRAPLMKEDFFMLDGFIWTAGEPNLLTCGGRLYSTEVPLKRSTPVPVTIPSDFAGAAMDASSINLTWLDVADGNSYRIERSVDGDTWTELAVIASGTYTYDDTGLEAETEYHYRLRAFDGASYSEYTGPIAVTTEAAP